MQNYIFKTYIDGGREYYEYTDAADRERTIKKDFPFPESLMSLLYMDIWELEPITKRMDKALMSFYQSRDYSELQIVAAGLKELAPRHICFELLRLDWLERLDMVDSTAPGDFQDLLPHKKISHLCSSIDTMQKQIKGLIAQVLDMDGEKKSVSEKMVAYYNAEGGDTLNTFQFQPQTMNFEVIDRKIFAEVLYPRDIYDLIDFHVRECVQELPALLRRDGQGQHGVLRSGLRQQGPHLPGDGGHQHMDAAQAGRRGVQGIPQGVQKAFRPHQRRQADQERILRLE